MTVHWDITQAPSLKGKVAVVTGATGGLGYATARGLVSRGAEVILAGRNPAKGAAALERLRTDCPDGAVDFMTLDLASLQSIADFTQNLSGRTGTVDILVNNAGVMGPPKRQETIDGFELQFGTNYLGPFALTARLRPLLCAGKAGARVVTVASLAALSGKLVFDDLQARHHYTPFGAYRQSKLADLILALELDRQARQHGWPIHSIAAHPGWAMTDIAVSRSSNPQGLRERLLRRATLVAFTLFGQSADHGALPILFAATAPQARDGGYYGPDGWGERRGNVTEAIVPPAARDLQLAQRLWQVSERLTGTALS
ncbi:SDR family oxidoreductase [Gluconacetobacter entanii]|uniref:SDR family oxidoreductase n=1 Tax=Gluconacetobacter entanii TaxID=108528 RepID=UPI001C9329D6|nr:SDR family oxidoreductase [Gluconacetobacter entanii]MBY4638776.1 SDR family oxidoreductase [Gluconacetobacter entanii]MCW4580769.1 SDR family oxidoreductase [Gluconacetobacter entanii]MCW4584098.1 SDR family oxidoreductase [Gluconacetobacter entanii]MCW4587439.1 SDR family oxidoreductase [Gluconacetobacter entanii]